MLFRKRDTPKSVLLKMREHIERNGITGGSAYYAPNREVCPRGLVSEFTDSGFTTPNKLAAETFAALDGAADHGLSAHAASVLGILPQWPGYQAELEGKKIKMTSLTLDESKRRGVEFIDRALEKL